MPRQSFLLSIVVATLLSYAAWFVVYHRLAPYGSDRSLAILLFFVSAFFAITGTCTLIGYFLRVYLHRNEVFFSHIGTSLRQGILLALFSCFCFMFLTFRVFTWWNASLLFLSLLLIEVFFLSRRKF